VRWREFMKRHLFQSIRSMRVLLILLISFIFSGYVWTQGKTDFSGAPLPMLRAVVVGVSQYKYSEDTLHYAAKDAVYFRDLLSAAKGVQFDTGSVILLTDSMATHNRLRTVLGDIIEKARKGDIIVFYFSGHGGISSVLPDKRGMFYMYDSDFKQKMAGFFHAEFKLFFEILLNATGCKIYFIADACHSGRFLGNPEPENGLNLLSDQSYAKDFKDNIVVLASSKGGEYSYEVGTLKHGLFTYYLIEGALGAADTVYTSRRDGVVYSDELGEYVRQKMLEFPFRDGVVQNIETNHSSSKFLRFDSNAFHYATEFNQKYETGSLQLGKKKDVFFDSTHNQLLSTERIIGSSPAALDLIRQFRETRDTSEYFSKVKSELVLSLMDNDDEIIYRFLNQDITPWISKYEDIDKGIQINLLLSEITEPQNFLLERIVSRYFFYQALIWYEYAKFGNETERQYRLRNSAQLIDRVLKTGIESPLLLYQKMRTSVYFEPDTARALLNLIHGLAPEWRMPYLYSGSREDLGIYSELFREDEAGSRSITDTLEVPGRFVIMEKSLTPDVIVRLSHYSPLFFEDLFAHFLVKDKFRNRKYLRAHSQLLNTAVADKMYIIESIFQHLFSYSQFNDRLLNKYGNELISVNELLDKDTVSGFPDGRQYIIANRILPPSHYEEVPDKYLSHPPSDDIYFVSQFDELDQVVESVMAEINPVNSLGDSDSIDSSGYNALIDPENDFRYDIYKENGIGSFILIDGSGCRIPDYRRRYRGSRYDHSSADSITISFDNYYIGVTEVTQAQWRAVMGSNIWNYSGCDNCPVENVSKREVERFIKKLNKKSGHIKYRLPTVAEWQFAATGAYFSKKYSFPGGNNIDSLAWYENNAAGGVHSVKGKASNEIGLYDMAGNVWEFCELDQLSPRQLRINGYFSKRAIACGGGWSSESYYCQPASCVHLRTNEKLKALGFRLAFSLK